MAAQAARTTGFIIIICLIAGDGEPHRHRSFSVSIMTIRPAFFNAATRLGGGLPKAASPRVPARLRHKIKRLGVLGGPESGP
ncbi:hypothetical protein [Pseudotabrizicola alkalilacus]|uniref:hypothetical protein n=1 Tax=Pseudotabrizicola alkalilacus TaxID=2305252 RepID=UPI0018F1BE13|nr:hypothetical protein [Pseudotabrizicola alkalilacus]